MGIKGICDVVLVGISAFQYGIISCQWVIELGFQSLATAESIQVGLTARYIEARNLEHWQHSNTKVVATI